MAAEFPELPLRPLCGHEPVVGTAPLIRPADFWQWSMSGLMENTTRGPLAEFLVATALGVQDKPQKNWENYDLLWPWGGRAVKIEVKSSAERQSWRCKPAASHSFDIRKTEDSDQHECGKRRWSDVYVFCILRNRDATEQSEALDTRSWTFLILPTATLDRERPDGKSISDGPLRTLGAIETDYAHLKDEVTRVADSLS